MKSILRYFALLPILLGLAACGAASGTQAPKTTATLKINLTGSLPVSNAISGVGFTLTLPADVTPSLTNGSVADGVVSPTGTFADNSLSPQIIYTPATLSLPGTLKVTLASSLPAGVTQAGEVATIILQLANGAAPTTANFSLSTVNVIDTFYNSISGMGVSVAQCDVY